MKRWQNLSGGVLIGALALVIASGGNIATAAVAGGSGTPTGEVTLGPCRSHLACDKHSGGSCIVPRDSFICATDFVQVVTESGGFKYWRVCNSVEYNNGNCGVDWWPFW